MQLRELAHARTGDKGNISHISVIAHEPGDYAFLAEHVTAERVQAHLAPTGAERVDRYELPGLGALELRAARRARGRRHALAGARRARQVPELGAAGNGGAGPAVGRP